jgi:hypothetical protein
LLRELFLCLAEVFVFPVLVAVFARLAGIAALLDFFLAA